MLTKEDIVNLIRAERLDRQVRVQSNAAYFAAHNSTFAALYNRGIELELEYARAFDDSRKQANIRAEQAAVKRDVIALLKRAKIAENEVFFVPVCKKCGDDGFINNGDFCNCVLSRFAAESIKENGLAPYIGASLGDVSFAEGSAQQKDVAALYGALTKYAEKFPDVKFSNILLTGGTGTGKSYALAALSYELLKKGKSVLFIGSCALSDLFLRYHRAGYRDKQTIIADLLDVDFLVIDDLGAEPVFKNVTEQYLLFLLNIRAERGLGTAISTNYSVTDGGLEQKYGDRVASRLLDSSKTWIKQLKGNDLRRR